MFSTAARRFGILCSARKNFKARARGQSGASTIARRILEVWTQMPTAKRYQWYSRRRMWHFAEERGKNYVEELDDQEFLIGLGVVNEYFKLNLSCRARWSLEAKRGPQGLEDRRDENKMAYLGAPLVYKYYDKELFIDELKFFRRYDHARDRRRAAV